MKKDLYIKNIALLNCNGALDDFYTCFLIWALVCLRPKLR